MSDAAPELPTLTESDLAPADVLLWRGRDWADRLIPRLDRGRYADAGVYDGQRVIVCGRCGVERRPPFPADVYRFHHDGRPLGRYGLSAQAVLAGADAYLAAGPEHRGTSEYLLGLLLIMRRTGHSRLRRLSVEAAGTPLLSALRRTIGHVYPAGTTALTGSELVTELFGAAGRRSGLPYHILSAPAARHPRGAWPPTSGRYEHLMQEIEELLTRAKPDLPVAVSRARATAPGGHQPVAAGGPLAPACLVTPGDLEHSPSLIRIGRLRILR
ncbi:MAG TPA: hypothetical protein VF210_05680 [Pseudomonadales bacterium]